MIVPLCKKNRCPASALLTNIAGSNGIRVRYTELTLFLSYLDCQNSFSSDFLWPCLLICLFLCLCLAENRFLDRAIIERN